MKESNHLGNVRVVVSDLRNWSDANTNNTVDAGENSTDVKSWSDLYAFGSPMASRNKNSTDYRYGFNGMEKVDELKGSGNSYEFKYRMYDARLGKFLSVDPLSPEYPWNSPYAFAENDVIRAIDLEGAEKKIIVYETNFEGTTKIRVIKGIGDKSLKLKDNTGKGVVEDENSYLIIYKVKDKNGKSFVKSTHERRSTSPLFGLTEDEKKADAAADDAKSNKSKDGFYVETLDGKTYNNTSLKTLKRGEVVESNDKKEGQYGCTTCSKTGSKEEMSKNKGYHDIVPIPTEESKDKPVTDPK